MFILKHKPILLSSLQEFSTTYKLQYLGSSEQNKARYYPLRQICIISGNKVILQKRSFDALIIITATIDIARMATNKPKVKKLSNFIKQLKIS